MSRGKGLFGRVVPNGAERVVERLRAHGATLFISLPGSQVLPLWEAVDRCDGMHLLVPRTERSGVFIGEGYGLAKGLPAVVANTLGPGVANELVGVASSLLSEAPVIHLSPCQPPNKRLRIEEVFQGLDHASYMEGAALTQLLCDDSHGIEAAVDAAVEASLGDPSGPARVDVSFPLLFARSARRSPAPLRSIPPRPPLVGKGAELLLALESSGSDLAPVLEAAGLVDETAVTPGIDAPGFGLAFALGLRLGRTRAPVVLATDLESLSGQLEGFVEAAQAGVRVTLAAVDGSGPDGTVRLIADQAGAAWMPIEPGSEPADVRRAILARERSLTVLVSETA